MIYIHRKSRVKIILFSRSFKINFTRIILALPSAWWFRRLEKKRCWIDNTIWFLSLTVKPRTVVAQFPRIHIPGVVVKMHWMVRRIPRRISRSVNHCGEFNVSFSKECGTLGCDPRSFAPNEKDIARSSRNVVDQNATRTLSQTFQRDFSTFARKTPPEPRRVPFFGTMLSLMMAGGAQKLHEYVDRRHRKLGPVFREQIGPLWIVFVNSPDEFRKIFLRLEGPTPQHFIPEAWRLYNEIRAQRRGLIFMYA